MSAWQAISPHSLHVTTKCPFRPLPRHILFFRWLRPITLLQAAEESRQQRHAQTSCPAELQAALGVFWSDDKLSIGHREDFVGRFGYGFWALCIHNKLAYISCCRPCRASRLTASNCFASAFVLFSAACPTHCALKSLKLLIIFPAHDEAFNTHTHTPFTVKQIVTIAWQVLRALTLGESASQEGKR